MIKNHACTTAILPAILFFNFYSLQRKVAMIIDEMGKASARAQDLKMPITTAEKLSKSDHIVYLLSEQTNEEYVFYSYTKLVPIRYIYHLL